MQIFLLLFKFFGGLIILFTIGWLVAYLFKLENNIKK
jgi:hypothetical protein